VHEVESKASAAVELGGTCHDGAITAGVFDIETYHGAGELDSEDHGATRRRTAVQHAIGDQLGDQ
jgi:hypothetical protein